MTMPVTTHPIVQAGVDALRGATLLGECTHGFPSSGSCPGCLDSTLVHAARAVAPAVLRALIARANACRRCGEAHGYRPDLPYHPKRGTWGHPDDDHPYYRTLSPEVVDWLESELREIEQGTGGTGDG